MKLFKEYNRKTLLLKRKPEFPVGIFTLLNNFKTGKSLGARKSKKTQKTKTKPNSLFYSENHAFYRFKTIFQLEIHILHILSSFFYFLAFFFSAFSVNIHFGSYFPSIVLEHSEIKHCAAEEFAGLGPCCIKCS